MLRYILYVLYIYIKCFKKLLIFVSSFVYNKNFCTLCRVAVLLLLIFVFIFKFSIDFFHSHPECSLIFSAYIIRHRLLSRNYRVVGGIFLRKRIKNDTAAIRKQRHDIKASIHIIRRNSLLRIC